MANKDRAAGLIPAKHSAGGTPQRLSDYRIADGYGTSIYRGDLVKSSGTGRQVNKAGTTDVCVGVFMGCQYNRSDGSVVFSNHWPASTAIQSGTEAFAYVMDDPGMLFEAQADGDLQDTNIGSMAPSVNNTSGDDATGTSRLELDSSGIAASSKQLKIMELVQRADNAYGTNAKVLVLINKHENRAVVTAL